MPQNPYFSIKIINFKRFTEGMNIPMKRLSYWLLPLLLICLLLTGCGSNNSEDALQQAAQDDVQED